jgi:FMN-dependent oxidoreductase (nitrilotriacetate monooxygenase family)
MDPVVTMMAMGLATSRLGIASTASTTYYEPFDVARKFMTADHMLGGRVGWNVVTSVNDGEAHNMGREEHLGHDERYDRADEFMEVVLGHWDSWDNDALVIDKKSGRFADPDKVRRLDHKGKFFKSRGPFTVPRSPQGHPVIIQAGASGRGRRFAARWGEVIFSSQHTTEFAVPAYKALKDETVRMGRDPDQMFVCAGVQCVAGATRSEAEDKMAVIEKLPLQIDALSLLAEGLNFDFATKDMDEPLTTAELNSFTGMLTIRDHVLKVSGKENPTVRDFLKHNNRGQTHGSIVGGPKEIADRLEDMFVKRGCDGFVVAATHVPGAYEDFVRHVIPELQRRGLYHKDYAGPTLRENLGLPKANVGDWRD